MKEYTTKDTLNSISWQLKRIADALEDLVDQNKPKPKVSKNTTPAIDSTSLRRFLSKIGGDE